MKALKRIGLYGLSGIGKTTLLNEMPLAQLQTIWLEGSKLVLEAADLSLPEFKRLPDAMKINFREEAIAKAWAIQQSKAHHVIIDGHLAFSVGEGDFENVMTPSDRDFYTDFIYYELPPKTVYCRQKGDARRSRNFALETISAWIEYEREALISVCLETKAKFHHLTTESLIEGRQFITNVIQS